MCPRGATHRARYEVKWTGLTGGKASATGSIPPVQNWWHRYTAYTSWEWENQLKTLLVEEALDYLLHLHYEQDTASLHRRPIP